MPNWHAMSVAHCTCAGVGDFRSASKHSVRLIAKHCASLAWKLSMLPECRVHRLHAHDRAANASLVRCQDSARIRSRHVPGLRRQLLNLSLLYGPLPIGHLDHRFLGEMQP